MAGPMEEGWIGRATAEFVGTFALIFFGAGSIVVNDHLAATATTPEPFGLIGIAATHAIVLAIAVSATMNISGGHINPAVSIAAFLTRRLSAAMTGIYVVAQLAGGILGAAFVRSLLPLASGQATDFGATLVAPGTGVLTAVSLELILTFFLVFTIWGTAISKRAPQVGGFAIGLVLFFDIMVGGVFTGASMNPARSLGPALFSGNWSLHWIYWVGPILGGALAAGVYDGVVEKGAPQEDEAAA